MAFVLYLLYLCSVILFLYIRTILMESILITGASGFIGSFIVEEALKRSLVCGRESVLAAASSI